MMRFIRTFWIKGGKFMGFVWKFMTKYKPVTVFGLCLVLALIFRAVQSPLLFLFSIASYISGAILVFWLFSLIRFGRD